MNLSSSTVDRMRIATPCPVNWEQMTGDNRVRFCDHCRLNVYNLAELTRTEAETLIASTEGRLCARMYRRADGTVLTKDCPVGLRALRLRVSKRVAAMFAALVSISSAAPGQQQSGTDKPASCASQIKITRTTAPNSASTAVVGTTLDPTGAVLPGARITLINEATKEARTTITTEQGRFEFTSVAPGLYEVRIELAQFATHRLVQVAVETSQIVSIDAYLEFRGEPLSGVVAVDYSDVPDRKPGTFTITENMIKRLPIN